MVLLAAASVAACAEVLPLRFRSGTLALDGTAHHHPSLPHHRGDVRWIEAARALSGIARQRRRRLQTHRHAQKCLPASSSHRQAVVSFFVSTKDDGHRAARAFEEALAASGGVVSDYLQDGGALVAVDGDGAYGALVDALAGVAHVAPLPPALKIAPELQALTELAAATNLSNPAAAPATFALSRGLTIAVTPKRRASPEEERHAALLRNGSHPRAPPHGALDVRLLGSGGATLDRFSVATDAAGRLLIAVPTAALPHTAQEGREGRAQEAAVRATVAACCGVACDVTVPPEGGAPRVAVPGLAAPAVLDALAALPHVAWLEPELETVTFNHIAASVLQSSSEAFESPASRPFWLDGLDGSSQIIGVGDTGLDTKSCYFYDENNAVGDGHYKVVGYRGFADYEDTSGHGTHVCGSIAGRTQTAGYSDYNGMAPGAKLAFTDLGLSYGDQRGLIAPDTMSDYYRYAYNLGARLHSDSWGGLSTAYTRSAREVDEYHFYHPEFLAMIAAGNDGEYLSAEGVESTVSTPATCKNALAVGATRSLGRVDPPVDPVINFALVAPHALRTDFQVVSSLFSPIFSFEDNGTALEVVTMDSDPRACADLTDAEAAAMRGRIVLVERGDCYFIDKVRRVNDAGAIGAIIYNNEESGMGFFKMASAQDGFITDLPTASVPASTGRMLRNAMAASDNGTASIVTLSAADEPLPAFESIAEYSSFGPTRDGRVKPDVVAPGEAIKSATSVDRDNECSTRRISGTSMATPLVAGIAGIVRQYLMEGRTPSGEAGGPEEGTTPSGALIKAVIINGAVPLRGYAQSGLPLEPPPSFRQGWGRVELASALPLPARPASLQVADWKNLRGTGDAHAYCLSVPEGSGVAPVSVTLAWMDAPGSLSGSGGLVNDLDLEIEVPVNASAVSWGSAERPDRKNNVEKGVIHYPVPGGHYGVTVRAYDVRWKMGNGNDQLYAMAVTGPEGLTLTEGECVAPEEKSILVAENGEGGSDAVSFGNSGSLD